MFRAVIPDKPEKYFHLSDVSSHYTAPYPPHGQERITWYAEKAMVLGIPQANATHVG